jgi:excisionase family DNA binding protein
MLYIYCESCGKNSDFLSINEASVVASISRRTVYNWIAAGRLHLLANAGGHTLICKWSLVRPYGKPPPGRAGFGTIASMPDD